MDTFELAYCFRVEREKLNAGGYIIFYDGEPERWEPDLLSPNVWKPGAMAVDDQNNRWMATGGNPHSGALSWEPAERPTLNQHKPLAKDEIYRLAESCIEENCIPIAKLEEFVRLIEKAHGVPLIQDEHSGLNQNVKKSKPHLRLI